MALKDSQTSGATQHRRFTDSGDEFDTVIGPQAQLTGEIRGRTNLRVWGTIDGSVEVDGLFWLCSQGEVKEAVSANDMVIEGKVTGSLTAADKVDLRPTARVNGDIKAKTLAVAEGSFFEGRISMPGGTGAAKVVKYQEKRIQPEAEPE
jgi:cytoskeletal protein CcmA (bactofilin family)